MSPRDGTSPPRSRWHRPPAIRARSTAFAVLAAGLAVLAFTFGAATLGTALPDGESSVSSDGGPTVNKSGGITGGGGGQRGPSGEASEAVTCTLLCPAALLPAVDGQIVVGIGLLAIIGAIVVGYRLTGGTASSVSDDESDDGRTLEERSGSDGFTPQSLDEPVTNDVYRAWTEFRTRVSPRVDDPATATPGEYERTAYEAGLDPDPVAELTELFRRVRYRGDEPTEQREQQATDALADVPADISDEDTPTDDEPDPARTELNSEEGA